MNLIKNIYAGANTTVPINKGSNFTIENIGSLVSNVVNALLIIAALAAFIFLVLGGIQWITSAGDKAGMEAARNKITHAVVGLIIVAAAYAIMLLLGSFLGLDISQLNIGTAYQ
jgi:hypothetical protein